MDNIIDFKMPERVDSNSSGDLDRAINATVGNSKDAKLVIDADALNYISSAGLRVLLKYKKLIGEVSVINVSLDVYEIFETTGFTEIMDVHKKLKTVDVEGLEFIGAGQNGRVYKLDDEKIIKVYNRITNTPEKIERERFAARQAFIHDIPSAIPFETVKVGEDIGMIYELINAKTLGKFLCENPDKMPEYAKKMGALLRKLHTTEFAPGELPDARLGLKVWADVAKNSGRYPDDVIDKLYEVIDVIPVCNTFIHGDYHPGNIMVVDGELVLIDMGDASLGHPLVDLLCSFQIMKVVTKHPGGAMRYAGVPDELIGPMWDIYMDEYYKDTDEDSRRRLEKMVHDYAIVRALGGVVVSDVVRDEIRDEAIAQVTSAFRARADRMIASWEKEGI